MNLDRIGQPAVSSDLLRPSKLIKINFSNFGYKFNLAKPHIKSNLEENHAEVH
jgi:hypothetical protein